MINIQLNDTALQNSLRQIQANATHTALLMRKIAGELHTQADMNIRQQKGADGARFADLAESTKKARENKGKWPGQILQVNNILVRSITRKATGSYAQVGTNIIYARIQQLGGNAGRGRRVAIPARPFLPFHDNDKLQEGMEGIILNHVIAHLSRNV